MKNLHWSKLQADKIVNTVWAKADDNAVLKTMDAKEFENMFAIKVSEKPADIKLNKTAKPKAVSLLDPKRSQNVSIMTSGFNKMTFVDVRNAILAVNDKDLSIDQLEAIANFLPTPEEITAIKGYTGSDPLGKAELYYKEISNVPRLNTRMRAMLFRRNFTRLVESLKPQLDVVLTATLEVKNSKKFVKILEYVRIAV